MKDNIANLKETFLTAEREYILELMEQRDIIKLIKETKNYNTELLFEAAHTIITEIESGNVPDEQMEYMEQRLIIILASIQDKALIKNETLIPSINDEITR